MIFYEGCTSEENEFDTSSGRSKGSEKNKTRKERDGVKDKGKDKYWCRFRSCCSYSGIMKKFSYGKEERSMTNVVITMWKD